MRDYWAISVITSILILGALGFIHAVEGDSLQEQKSSITATLEGLKTGDDKLDKKIDKVIKHIDKATDDKFWADDGESLESKKSKKVFDEEKKAVKGLLKILKKGDSGIEPEISIVIDLLVAIDLKLATDALAEAEKFGGDKAEKEIEKAKKEFAKAAEELAKGKPDKAIDHYKKVWQHALKAIKKGIPIEVTATCPQPQGFDVFPDGTVPTGGFADPTQVTTEWAACGIALLTSTDPGGPQIFNFATTGKSPPNTLAGCDKFDDVLLECGSEQFFQPIGVEFTDPVSSASITALGVGCRGLILDGYNSVGTLVDSDSVVNPSSGAFLFDTLSISGSDIVRLDIHQKFPTLVCGFVLDGYSIDDLSYIFE